jgi:hypothetical protein
MDSNEIKLLIAILLVVFLFRNSQWGSGKTSDTEKEVAFFLSKAIVYPILGIGVISILWFGFFSHPLFWIIIFFWFLATTIYDN